MNPARFSQMMKYLTRAKKQKPDLPDVFPARKAPIPPKTQNVKEIEAVNQFMLRNPRKDMANGGSLKFYPKVSGGETTQKVAPGIDLKTRDINYGGTLGYEGDKFYGGVEYNTGKVKFDITDSDGTTLFKDTLSKDDAVNFIVGLGDRKGDKFQIRTDKDFTNMQVTFRKSFADGGRIGYRKAGDVDPPKGNELEIAEKKYSEKYNKKGIDLWKELKQSERSNIRQKQTTGGTSGVPGGKLKKNQIGKDDFIKLVKTNKDKTYNQFVEILKDYRTKDNKPFTNSIVSDRLRDYGLSGSFKKEPPKGNDPTVKAAAERKRQISLKETDPTGAKGTKKFNYHHIRQIEGGVPLTTDDVMIINQKINSQLGGETNKALNRISAAIRKNNILALEAMNAKNEGAALDYMKRVDELNAQAEKIVNSAINKLPKKYKGYVGFNQFTLPRDEYGLPIGNEPMIVKKVGGVPVSQDAIDLTTLTKKGEAEFKKIVRAQAEKGEVGPIKNIEKLLASFGDGSCAVEFGKGKKDGGRIGYKTGTASLNKCIESGARNFNDGKFKTADQVQDAAKLLRGGRAVVSGLMKYGIIPELAYVGLEAAGRTLLGEQPTNALLKSIDTLTFGVTDFGSGIEAEKFGKFSDQKLAVDKFRNSQALVNSLQSKLKNLENISSQGGEDYIGNLTSDIQITQAQLQAAEQELQKNTVSSDIVQFIDKKGQEIADTQMAKSDFAKQSLKDQMEGIPGIRDYTDTESTRIFPLQPSQIDLNLNMFPTLPTDLMQLKTSDAIDLAQALRAEGKNVSAKDILAYRDELKQMPLSKQAEIYGDEQTYGTQGAEALQPLAGGGIAKMAGVDSGPPPESGPNSQGLLSLKNRVRNY